MRTKEKEPVREGGKRLKIAIAAITFAMIFAAATPFFLGGGNDEGGDTPLGAGTTQVHVANTYSVSQIQGFIQDELNNAANDTVIVANLPDSGGKTNVDAGMSLTIPTGKTLIWKATYTGVKTIINLSGNGTFEVADGAVLIGERSDTVNAYDTDVHILVSGGTVENTNTDGGDAIHVGKAGIEMTGGLLKTVGDGETAAIYAGNSGSGVVEVRGGTVWATGDGTQAIYANNFLTVSGGTVKADGTGSLAIYQEKGVVVYLKGTVLGAPDSINVYRGTALRVDVLSVPTSYHGTADKITNVKEVIGSGTTWRAMVPVDDYRWLTNGEVPVIEFLYPTSHNVAWFGDGIAAPAAPTLLSKTHESVTLTAVAGNEYSRDGTVWQTSNIFGGLSADTEYTFYQRTAETDDAAASSASPGLTVRTNTAPGGTDTGGPAGNGGSNTWLYVGIAVGVILALAAVYFFVLKKK